MKSWEATRWVKKIKFCPNGEAITRSEKLLLLTIADDHREAMGCAWISEEILAGNILSSERQVRRLLNSLERKKLLTIERPPGDTNRYFINCEAEATAGRPVFVATLGRGEPSRTMTPVDNPVDNSVDNVSDPGHHVRGTPDILPPLPRTFCHPTPDIVVSAHPGHSCVRHSEEEDLRREDEEGAAATTISRLQESDSVVDPPSSVTAVGAQHAAPCGGAMNHAPTRTGARPTPGRWASPDLWLKEFLDGPACFFIPMGTLDDPLWWDAVSIACGGVERDFVRETFAKIHAWLLEQPGREPATAAEWKEFVRRWLCRENDWEQAQETRRKA